MEGNMDAKKLTGMLVAVLIVVPILATAPPSTLALVEVALVGLLFGIRRRRVAQ
jgi:MYXO-CTERM domain-containing protein